METGKPVSPAADPWAETRRIVAGLTSADSKALFQQFVYLREQGFEHRAGMDGEKGRMRRVIPAPPGSVPAHVEDYVSTTYQYIQYRHYKGAASWKADCYEPYSHFQSPWLPTAAACLAFAEVENWGR